MIKLYAKLAALNFPQAKVSLENGNAKFSAKAKDLQKYLSEIHTAGLNFTITPDYPYTKSKKTIRRNISHFKINNR